jgi:hypothetical protein
MTKKEIKSLYNKSVDITFHLYEVISSLTNDNPLVLFDPEEVDNDNVYIYPYGYYVDKYGYNLCGVIMSVHEQKAKLFVTNGDSWGDIIDISLNDIPFESRIDILEYLYKRM